MSRNGVGYPIRSDLAWIVGQNGDPGSDARFHDNRRETKIPIGHLTELLRNARNDG
jgi:hypothetical protein